MKTFVNVGRSGALVPLVLAMMAPVIVSGSPVTCRVEVDRGVLPAGSQQRAIVKVTLGAERVKVSRSDRPNVNLAIVLDRSGSMSGGKLEKAKEAAIQALRRLGAGDLFSLVIYDHNVETIVPAQSAANTEWIEGRIRSIRSGGNTALFGGVSQGAAEIRKNLGGDYVQRVILLSDGIANVGPASPSDLGRLGAALVKEGISVSTVGVGTDYNEDLMTRLSQNSDGNTYFVEDSVDLPRIFASELGDVLSVVAKDVDLVIECPEGIRPVSIVGRDGRIKGNSVELHLNQLYGGQEKYALIEVEVPGADPGSTREIAVAKVNYEDALSNTRQTSSARTTISFSDKEKDVERSVNVHVQKAHVVNVGAEAREKAVSYADKGKKQEAVRQLRTSAASIRQLGEQENDEELLKEAEEMEQQAESVEKKGMNNKLRKSIKTDAFQIRNQQKQ